MQRWLTVPLLVLSMLLSMGRLVLANGHGDTLRYWVLIDNDRREGRTPGQRSADITDRTALALSGLTYDRQGAIYWSVGDSGDNTAEWFLYLYRIKVNANRAQVLEKIPIRDQTGRHLTGADLDPEDLTIAADGTFWAVDEHGLQVVEPPEKCKKRRQGQGFEGAAFGPDGKRLFIMLQSGLAGQSDFTLTWILSYDTETGEFTEWSYQLERPSDYDYSDTPRAVRMGSSGIFVLDDGSILVLERDNLEAPYSRVKQVHRAYLPTGGGAATKELVADLIALGYPYEKAEGITVPQPNTIVIINDNDGDPENPTALWFLHENL
jgi:hypothetical protein